MKYSITVLQAEVNRYEHAIKENDKIIALNKEQLKNKDFPKGSKGAAIHTNNIGVNKACIKDWEKSITELKADIKKL